MPAIANLPYLGKPKERPALRSPVIEISMSSLSEHEHAEVMARMHTQNDPYVTLTNKIERLAELLHCTEAEAERLFFDRL